MRVLQRQYRCLNETAIVASAASVFVGFLALQVGMAQAPLSVKEGKRYRRLALHHIVRQYPDLMKPQWLCSFQCVMGMQFGACIGSAIVSNYGPFLGGVMGAVGGSDSDRKNVYNASNYWDSYG